MSNLRVVYSNAADRASLTATAGVGTLIAANLLTDIKSEVWRTSSTSATITLTWASAENVGVVALPFCSLSQTATMRVRGYTNAGDTSASVDTGTTLACPVSAGTANWSKVNQGVNHYAYAGGTYGISWFTATSVKKIVIDIIDSGNPLGYIEASRVVAGAYWSPVNNVEHGSVSVALADRSKHERSDAGDLRTDRGTMSKSLSIDLTLMPAADRNAVWTILRTNGMYAPLLLSVVPQATDSSEEQIFQVYGKLSQLSAMQYKFMDQYGTSIELEEI